MDFLDDGTGIVCAAILLVLLINLVIMTPFLLRILKSSGNPLKRLKSPWHNEQEAFDELRRKLDDLDPGIEKEKTTCDDQ
jgi:hypothetical protein